MKNMVKDSNEDYRLRRYLIVFVLFLIVGFCMDAFVIHSIPPQADHKIQIKADYSLDLDATDRFHHCVSGTKYADADLLDSYIGSKTQMYLIQQDGEAHLLIYEFHFASFRGRLVADQVVDLTAENTYTLHVDLGFYEITISNGTIAYRHYHGLQKGVTLNRAVEYFFYFASALIIATIDNLLYRVYRHFRKKKTVS